MTIYRTAEAIASRAEHKDGLANIRAINKDFRTQDDSHLFPIRGRFNVTERAIRKARQYQRDAGAVYGLEYAYLLAGIIAAEVNNEGNW